MTVTTPFRSNTTPTRSFYKRTDEDVTGAVYDPARNLVFATVYQLSEVLVLNSTSGALVATIPFTEPRGIDESTDGTRVYVAGASSIGVIDPDSLQLIAEAPPPIYIPPDSYHQPSYIAALTDGKVAVLAYFEGQAGVFFWDPVAQTTTQADLRALTTFPSGMVRSGDHSKLLMYAPSPNGSLAMIYDLAARVTTGPFPYSGGVTAMNNDGTQIAAATENNLTLYDNTFDILATLDLQPDQGPDRLIYSRDGNFVYEFCEFGSAASVATIDARALAVTGISPDVQINEGQTQPFDIEETGMILGGTLRGMVFVDVSAPGVLSLPTFYMTDSDSLVPDAVSTSAPTSALVNMIGADPSYSYQAFFGAPPASPSAFPGTNPMVSSGQLRVTVPPAPPKVADMTVVRSDGWWAIAPLAAAFEPSVWLIGPNTGPALGGNTVDIYGWGLDAANTTVTIGGAPAILTKTIGPGSPSIPFPIETLLVTAPKGSAGPADVVITTPYGSTTVTKGYQYLASASVVAVQGGLNQIIYDPNRQRVYVSNGRYNQVDVFSTVSQSSLASIAVGNSPAGLALTPDGSRLAVTNASDGTLSVIDPAQLTVIATYNVLTQNDLGEACGGVPLNVAAAGSHGMMVSVQCTLDLVGGDLHYIDLNSGSLSCVGIPGCDTTTGTEISVQTGYGLASSPDGSKILIGGYGSAELIDLNANTLLNAGANTADGVKLTDVSIAHDQNLLNLNVGVYNLQFFLAAALQDLDFLKAGFLSATYINGATFSPSGSLLFVPQEAGPGVTRSIDVWDVHRQRLALQIALPEPLVPSLEGLCLDSTGSQIFAISQSGITMASLSNTPLSIASVNPPSAAVGATVSIRGSGFVNGATVSFGTVQGNASLSDGNTISAVVPSVPAGPMAVTVTNPDGIQYTFDAALIVN